MKATIGYVRVSTSKQLDGNGPDQQRASICAWAFANGIKKIDDWVIEDESGTKENREQVLKLLEMARAGALGRLIIDRMDRLGRRLIVCEKLFTEFQTLGVEVICTQMRLGNSPTDVLVRQMMGVLAEFQRSEWLSRMKSCRRLAVTKKGRFGGGKAPYGYRCAGDGKLELDSDAAEVVRTIFAFAETGASLRAVASSINSLTGLSLLPMQIKRILDREDFYRGVRPLGDAEYEAGVVPSHQPILLGDASMHAVQATVGSSS